MQVGFFGEDIAMSNQSIKRKSGPVSFAARVTKGPVKLQTSTAALTPAVDVEPLWTTKELGRYLQKSKNTLSDFLNRTSGFLAFKIGSEWRADPEEVKAWVRRQRVSALPDKPNEEIV
jgi:hypothetical protein